ncbi:MAG: hypothetical protein R3C11_17420 [Planctomycetaceae bacterium]
MFPGAGIFAGIQICIQKEIDIVDDMFERSCDQVVTTLRMNNSSLNDGMEEFF